MNAAHQYCITHSCVHTRSMLYPGTTYYVCVRNCVLYSTDVPHSFFLRIVCFCQPCQWPWFLVLFKTLNTLKCGGSNQWVNTSTGRIHGKTFLHHSSFVQDIVGGDRQWFDWILITVRIIIALQPCIQIIRLFFNF